MTIAYFRFLAAQELEETLKFGGLSTKRIDEKIRSKVVKGKSVYYELEFSHGKIQVFNPKNISVNDVKFKSVYDAQKYLNRYMV